MKLETKLKKWSLPKWKKEFWKVFSKYIKLRDNYICFTCGKKVSGHDAQAGHFIPASACGLELYFHEDNVHCQCSYCNVFLQGNQYVYGQKLGEKKVKELREILDKRNTILQYTRQDYARLIEKYKSKLKDIEQNNSQERS